MASNNASKLVKSKVNTNLDSSGTSQINSLKNISTSTPAVGSPSLKQSSSFSANDRKRTTEALVNIVHIQEEEDEEKEVGKVKLDKIERSTSHTPLQNHSSTKEELYMDQDVLGEDEDKEVPNARIPNKGTEYRIRTNVGKSKKQLIIIVKIFMNP